MIGGSFHIRWDVRNVARNKPVANDEVHFLHHMLGHVPLRPCTLVMK